MKSKLTITVASILSVLVLVGVGFAAWVISNPDVNAEQPGTITAETVSDKSYTLQAEITGGEIVFGAPATMDKTGAWLTAGSSAKTENRTATLKLTLKYKDWAYVPLNFSVAMNAKKDNAVDTVFTGLVSSNYITNPKISYNSGDATEVAMNGAAVDIAKDAFPDYNATEKDTEKEVSLTITITFGWGEAFGGNNPYKYYNALKYDDKHTEANTALTAISGLRGVSYVVTISGTTNVSGT